MEEQPKQNIPPAAPSTNRGLILLRNLWRRIENIVFGVVLLLIVLYFVLQMPAIQNWLIHKTTSYLSDELKTTVQIQHIDIAFFDKLILEGFYVEDLKGDTLIYVGQLSAGLSSNFFSILSNKLEFNEISLKNARIQIRRAAGEYDTNLKFFIGLFFQSERPQ
ncbi:MAG: hypothetical protein IPL27_10540 [Lewinellaceae bacterium]|nr:hypothetical protein [Lewinellaceae bacterium]